jgi:lactoylglutathione lyase
MITKLEHIGVMVSDMDRSIQFYKDALGLELVGRTPLNGAELAFLSYPGTEHIQLELISRWREDLPARGNVDHIAFSVSDIDAEVERLKSLGIEMIDQAAKEVNIIGPVKIAFFYGPDGERLELFERLS